MAFSMFIDIHTHLDHPLIKDIDALIANAKAAGVRHIITNGVDPKTNRISSLICLASETRNHY